MVHTSGWRLVLNSTVSRLLPLLVLLPVDCQSIIHLLGVLGRPLVEVYPLCIAVIFL